MKSAALTIKVFGVYAALTGAALLFAPNVLLPILGLPKTMEIWVHVLGTLALVVGYYYWACGVANVRAFFIASVQGRMAFCAACLALVVGADGPLVLIAFGLVDLAGAGWTLAALRNEARTG
ncbi:MAG: hypothetical protein AAB224_03055 [Gemmatimonadota bacterium]